MSTQPLFLLPLVRIVSMLVGTWLFARRLPRREGFVVRAAAITVAFAAVVTLIDWLGFVRFDFITRGHFLAWGLATRSALLAALVASVLVCFETSAWSAVFCALLGFTLEGAAEGLTMVVDVIVDVDPSSVPMSLEAIALAMSSSLIYLAVFFTYVRAVDRSNVEELDDDRMLAVFAAVVIVAIAFGQITQVLFRAGDNEALVAALELIRVLLCAFILFAAYEVLYSSRLREEMASIEGLMRSKEDQYRITRESMDAINVKCHDIRHQIRSLGQAVGVVDQGVLDDIAREVSVYDTRVRTGCDPLDTILAEKGLICEREGIAFSCIADGTALSFMQPSEVYSFFGNALDNAIEASRRIGDPSLRTISLSVRETIGMVSIHVENRFSGEVRFKGGLPQTSKEDKANHGFGTKSMALVVERHEGTLAMETQGDLFCLDAMMPLP